MPIYDYYCASCEKTEEKSIPFSEREKEQTCSSCEGSTQYSFPMSGIFGFQPFESYYDESLNMDIHGRRHKEQTMKALNVIEAGDKIHGSRNYDETASGVIKPSSQLSGRSLDDLRREDEKREEDKHGFLVATENKEGKIVDSPVKAMDLPNKPSRGII